MADEDGWRRDGVCVNVYAYKIAAVIGTVQYQPLSYHHAISTMLNESPDPKKSKHHHLTYLTKV